MNYLFLKQNFVSNFNKKKTKKKKHETQPEHSHNWPTCAPCSLSATTRAEIPRNKNEFLFSFVKSLSLYSYLKTKRNGCHAPTFKA